tara:strand:+ start:361 stop:543 length:183 start_codon:yes stop_codon:yes gene_type:complete
LPIGEKKKMTDENYDIEKSKDIVLGFFAIAVSIAWIVSIFVFDIFTCRDLYELGVELVQV